MRDELLDGEIFYSLKEVQVLIEIWRKHYNTIRPHSALGYHNDWYILWCSGQLCRVCIFKNILVYQKTFKETLKGISTCAVACTTPLGDNGSKTLG
jgi:hypothetical protein